MRRTWWCLASLPLRRHVVSVRYLPNSGKIQGVLGDAWAHVCEVHGMEAPPHQTHLERHSKTDQRRSSGRGKSTHLHNILTHPKLNRPPIQHNIVMAKPILRPPLAIDLDTLDKELLLRQRRRVTRPVAPNPQVLVPVDGDIDIGEPRRSEQIDRLRHDRIQPQHLPDKPRVECAGVAVPGHAVLRVVEELVC